MNILIMQKCRTIFARMHKCRACVHLSVGPHVSPNFIKFGGSGGVTQNVAERI
jgi:hypothetical protein